MGWTKVVDIYEPSGPAGMKYPILTHLFRGATKAEADGYFKAHMTTDEFLRGCVEKKRWNGLKCRVFMGWQRF